MFARDAHIRGFCSVGEKGAGFVVYDIEVVTKEVPYTSWSLAKSQNFTDGHTRGGATEHPNPDFEAILGFRATPERPDLDVSQKRAMPPLPKKSSFGMRSPSPIPPNCKQATLMPSRGFSDVAAKFRPSFLERRQRQLGYWLQTVLLHPETGGCGIVREWILR